MPSSSPRRSVSPNCVTVASRRHGLAGGELEVQNRIPRGESLVVDGEPGAEHAECFPEAVRFTMGADGVLLNTAVAKAANPVTMAGAFAAAVDAGRTAYHAGFMTERDMASPSTPVAGMPFWHTAMRGG